MIQRLRKKFILMAAFSLSLVLITVIGGMVSVTYINSRNEINNVLDILTENRGMLPGKEAKKRLGPKYTPESIYQYRYFSALMDKNGKIIAIDNRHINTLSQTEIKKLTKKLVGNNEVKGDIIYKRTGFAYQLKNTPEGKIVVLLDESNILENARAVTRLGLYLGIISMIVFTLIISAFSKQAIKPTIQAYQKQKEFITNASHELKTPLAVISANTEMQELIGDESEWTKSNKEQISRLNNLISRLVTLARFEENKSIEMHPIDYSKIVLEAAKNFQTIAQVENKTFELNVTPNLFIQAEANTLQEMVNILIDNAVKYCDDNGKITVSLLKGKLGQNAILKVANTHKNSEKINVSRFFERFYRDDQAHSVEKSGYGIGLSMANEVVRIFQGKISGDNANGQIEFVVSFKLTKNSPQ